MIYVTGFCPMGCGETLVLAMGQDDTGEVLCSSPECPRLDAAATILADSETEHLVELGARTFSLQHPLRERVDGRLFHCEIHDVIRSLDGPPAPPGMYRTVDGRTFEAVPDGA